MIAISKNFRFSTVTIGIYFLIALTEIIAEYLQNRTLILSTKPLLMPLLTLIYWQTSQKRNKLLVVSLVIVWIGNLFFLSKTFPFITIGSLFFSVFRVIMIYLIIKMIRMPGTLPMILGCLPFLFLYLFAINLTYEELGTRFYIFSIQGILSVVFSGIALGSYIFKPDKPNMYLVSSAMFFAFTQFLFLIKLFYLSVEVFQPISMALFVAAQFLLFKFMVAQENLSIAESQQAIQQ